MYASDAAGGGGEFPPAVEFYPNSAADLLRLMVEAGAIERYCHQDKEVARLWRVSLKAWRMARAELPERLRNEAAAPAAQAWADSMTTVRALCGLRVLGAWAYVNCQGQGWELDTHHPESPFVLAKPHGDRMPYLWKGEPYAMRTVIHLRRAARDV